jgi:hypothetical protein
MRSTINLNAQATRMMNGMTKVRVKVEAGILMIKPTDRVCGKALPKGEKLVALSRKNSSTVKFGLRGDYAAVLMFGDAMGLNPVKHGWIALDDEQAEGAAVRVSKG